MRQPHPPDAGRRAAGASRRRVSGTEGSGALSGMRCVDGRVPVALDGSEHFRSRKLHCSRCPTRRAGGETEYFHGFVRASMVAPGQSRVLPLPPEFVRPRDGTGKRDCGSRAARVGPSMVELRPSIWATTSIPAGRPAKRSGPQAATSSSYVSCRATGRWANTCKGTEPQEIRRTTAGVRPNVPTGTGGWPARPCATAPMRSAPPGRRSRSPGPAAG